MVKSHVISFHGSCQHCGELWAVGPDYRKMRSELPEPLRPGTFKVPCPYCHKRNPVKVKKAGNA